MSSGITRWLDAPRIADPVDRRNAPMLQAVLGLLAILPPLLWLYRGIGTDLPWKPGETASLVTSLVISALALWSLLLIRKGRFQWAVRQMLAVVAAMMLVSYSMAGLMSHTFEQPIQVMWLLVAGMMIGRRALWGMYAVLVLAMVLGAHTDANRTGEPLGEALADVGVRTVMFLLITFVVDRTSAALRGSLSEATRQAASLADANKALSEEIAARERAQAQLLHAQRVEAVGRMASGVAHDFNHLLTLMLGYVDRGRHAESPQELDAVLSGIDMAVRRATAITHKLLRFARDDVQQLERFDASDTVREIVPMLRQTLGPRVSLVLDVTERPCPIVFDRAQFALMLLNLTANAAQAMPEGGRFQLRVSRSATDDDVSIEVSDSGHGIPADVLKHIFDPFFTTRPAGQGTGLGLAVVAGLVADSQGTIAVDSRPGKGATFVIRLPTSKEEQQKNGRAA
ncbi:histidine kinase [Lysobacteraceae bacterium NML93-0399]|nr:histidine kinase [Xanthomonadaceae bacterium NML93-0399]